jgi:hypothetical protein
LHGHSTNISRVIDEIGDKAALPRNWQPRSSRKKPDDARNNAWLAIKELAQSIANNEAAIRDNKAGDVTATDSLWDTVNSRCDSWVVATE